MEELKIRKDVIELASDIEDLTIERYNAFNLNLLLDSEVGNSMDQIIGKLSKLDNYLSAGMLDEARAERRNLQLTFFSTLEKINYASRAFACLVTSVNGVACTDLSDQGISNTVERLKQTKIKQADIIAHNQKKKNTSLDI